MGQRRRQGQRTLLAIAGVGWLAYKVLQWGRQENLYGQVALITGGSRGLGLALARELARVGCRLVLAVRDAQELVRAQQDLTQRGTEVLAVPCDVTNQEQVHSLVDQATQRFGRVDIVVNNAGIIQVGPMSTTTVEDGECPGRDVLGCTLSHASGAASDAGAPQWARSEYYLHWRHGECPPPVTIYLCQVRRRRPVRGPTGRTWPGRHSRDHRGTWLEAQQHHP